MFRTSDVFLFVFLVFVSSLPSSAVYADLLISVTEVGEDVVVTAEGALNIEILNFLETTQANDIFVDADTARLFSGADGFAAVDRYEVPQGPASFGPGVGARFADLGSGDRVGIVGTGAGSSELYLPVGYSSGDAISSSMTFENETIDSLGLVDGLYVFDWGNDSAR